MGRRCPGGAWSGQPTIPNLGDDDRAAETWEPLLAIADSAGADWPTRAREAAIGLHGDQDTQRESEGIRLLADIRDVFDLRGVDRMFSADLASALGELEESPWGDLRGRALDARGLADRLRPRYAIRPRTIRIGEDRAKGYIKDDFEDAWSRYLPSPSKPDSERDTVTSQVRGHIPSEEPEPGSGPKIASDQGSHDVTAERPYQGVTDARGGPPDYHGNGLAGFPGVVEAIRSFLEDHPDAEPGDIGEELGYAGETAVAALARIRSEEDQDAQA